MHRENCRAILFLLKDQCWPALEHPRSISHTWLISITSAVGISVFSSSYHCENVSHGVSRANLLRISRHPFMCIFLRHSRSCFSTFIYCRDCPGVGTSSGPAGKEVSYHGNVGGSSVGYKPPPQHSPQTRGPPPHFPQESVGPPANSPPLHINICGQVSTRASSLFDLSFLPILLRWWENYLIILLQFQENAMRGPLLNMSPGLGASGVDMEYRRNSQGMSCFSLSRPFICESIYFFLSFSLHSLIWQRIVLRQSSIGILQRCSYVILLSFQPQTSYL